MRTCLLFLLLTLHAVASDMLVPHPAEYEVEGCRFPCLTLADGDLKTLTPPKGWECSGGLKKATFLIPDKVQADAAIEMSSLDSPDDLEALAASINESAASFLPRDSKDVTVETVGRDCPSISGHPTLEMVLSYSRINQRWTRSILLLNRDKMRVSFVLDCHSTDFAELHEQFRRSLYTVQGL
jgi:hypothetical protein